LAITPAGRVMTVHGPGLAGPWGVTVAPDRRHALVTSSGQAAQIESTEVFDLDRLQRIDIESYDGNQGESLFYGVGYSPDGRRAWASGGGQGVVHAHDVATDGSLTAAGDLAAGFFPAGLAFGRTPRGDRLYRACPHGSSSTAPVSQVPALLPSPASSAGAAVRLTTTFRLDAAVELALTPASRPSRASAAV
jgi:hypothetical protein